MTKKDIRSYSDIDASDDDRLKKSCTAPKPSLVSKITDFFSIKPTKPTGAGLDETQAKESTRDPGQRR